MASIRDLKGRSVLPLPTLEPVFLRLDVRDFDVPALLVQEGGCFLIENDVGGPAAFGDGDTAMSRSSPLGPVLFAINRFRVRGLMASLSASRLADSAGVDVQTRRSPISERC